MKASRKDIARAVAARLAEGHTASELAPALADYLVQERRVRDLDAIMRDVQTVRSSEYGIVEANVTTAEQLNDDLAEQARNLIEQYTGHPKTVVVDSTIDDSLIGGVKVSTINYELDASIRTKLKTLRNISSLKGNS